ncbi:single-stranded DNA-binding protein [Kibdelosporangium aridum]|uniref:Single-stranded DNA-binding protein n=1 Tax=Kibdelosporangium aridum TaxID=2030 RepID=A0A1W2DPK6_KIBAR|nr:single-stranded DNA-binding protein [Kibdelosporangium aridum]SMC98996.1 single-strand DNA-binding protein [Kibdelosporangium aridum]
MSGLPEVTMSGTLTADPELRYTANGMPVANFTVAANDRRYDQKTGTWIDGDATFLRCTVWRQIAENLVNSLSKGARVMVTGALRQRSYTTNQGDKRYAFELDVTEVAASLRWATVTVTKATRTDENTGAQSGATGSQWNSEPPF